MEAIISQNCSNEESNYIVSKLIEYNLKNVPTDENTLFEPLRLTLRDANGSIIGGLLGEFACWHRLSINIFWIDEEYRKYGYGKKLLKKAEDMAVQKGCKLILLDTFSFQAPDFYLKNSYEYYATLDKLP